MTEELKQIYGGNRDPSAAEVRRSIPVLEEMLAEAERKAAAARAERDRGALRDLTSEGGSRRLEVARQRIAGLDEKVEELRAALQTAREMLVAAEAREKHEATEAAWEQVVILLAERTAAIRDLQATADSLAVKLRHVQEVGQRIHQVAPVWPQYPPGSWGQGFAAALTVHLYGASGGLFAAATALSPYEVASRPDLAAQADAASALILSGRSMPAKEAA